MELTERKIKYKEICGEYSLPIFFQPWWLDIVCQKGKWEVCFSLDKEGQLCGVLPYYLTKYFGFKLIRMAPFTPYMGIWLNRPEGSIRNVKKYSFENKVMKALLTQLPSVCWYHQIHLEQIENWHPFYLKNFRQTTRYTYVFENRNAEDIYREMKHTVRNIIRKAEKAVQLVKSDNPKVLLKLLDKTYARKGSASKIDSSLFIQLSEAILNNNAGEILIAKGEGSKKPVAGAFIIWDKESTYLWQLGVDWQEPESKGAAQLVIWRAIQSAVSNGLKFNFEGSMLPGVEPMFRAFGADRKPVHQIYKASPRWLYMLRELL